MTSALPFVCGAILVLALGALVADRAERLGEHSYRWGLFLGIGTATLAALLLVPGISSFRAGANFEGSALFACTLAGAAGATGLVRRARFGVVFALLFYVQLALLPCLFNRVRGIPEEQHISLAVPLGIAILANYVYFRSRWHLLL